MPKGPGLLLTFLYYFSTATLLADVVFTQQLGVGLSDRAPLQVSIAIGLLTGLLGIYMNRSSTLNLTVGNQRRFLNKLEAALNEMGFDDKTVLEDYDIYIYSQSGWQRWFSGKMLVKVERQSATIVGRASNIRQLNQLVNPK